MEHESPKKDFLFIPGAIIIFLGLLISALPYFIVIGIPLYIVGAILVGVSRETKSQKLNWIVIPLAVYIGIVVVLYRIYWKLSGVY